MKVAMLAASFVLVAGITAAQTVIRVTADHPLREALDHARAAAKPVKIVFDDGRHELSEPLLLTSADDGLTIEAAAGAKPLLAGSVTVSDWKLVDEAKGLWQTEVPEAREGKWRPRQMFVSGRRAQRARQPNEGFFRARGSLPRTQPFAFPVEPGSLKPEWAARGDVEIVFYQKWVDVRLAIKQVDSTQNTALLNARPGEWMSESNCRYFVENAPEALDRAGEWHLDRQTGTLSYLAMPGWDPENAPATLPRTDCLLVLQGCRDVTIRGLKFCETDYLHPDDGRIDSQAASTRRGTVRASNSHGCVFEDCIIENTGGYALELGEGCRRWRVVGNVFRHLGAGGLRLGETRHPNPAGEVRFTDNEIAHYGRIHAAAVGILVLQSGKNHIAHNRIRDGFYTGISVGWTWGYQESPCRENTIEFNHVHTIGQGLLSDMGGIYTLGPQPGTVIRNNYFHDIVSHDYGGWGLYTDEGSSHIVLENNIVARCKSAGFHQHYGKGNLVRNNVFAWNREHSIMRSREEAHNSFTFERNIVAADSGSLLGSSWANGRFRMDRNCYWDTRHGGNAGGYQFAGRSWLEWQAQGHDGHSVIQDPQLSGDPLPRPRSAAAAAAIGFKVEDLPSLDTIGPRSPSSRQ